MATKRKGKCGYSSLDMLQKREIGLQLLKQDTLTVKYYKHMAMSWDKVEQHGAIFNLEFSPTGKILVAACEEYGILLYDPHLKECLHRLPKAHNDSVNCICFCNEQIFASGSDDCTIALWDTRMLNEKVAKLSGHTNWVKSLFYDTNTELLLSSAFDGTVRAWHINNALCSEHEKIFTNTDNLSRMQLTPAGDKLIISCPNQEGYGSDIIIMFHNLDLANFASDVLPGNLFNQDESELPRGGAIYNRNIPEKLTSNLEYPDIPMSIPSFDIHPSGTCLVSRYFTKKNVEYTTVHDVQYMSSYGSERRLSHYILESDSGRGFIKEENFSPDGRVIASPFAHGARLLAFDSDCCSWKKESEVKVLSEVKFLLGHKMPVCCCKFSPNHNMLLATGCLGGKIAFHEPKL